MVQFRSRTTKRNMRRALAFLILVPCSLFAQPIILKGRVMDPRGNALPNALIQVLAHDRIVSRATTGADGTFQIKIDTSEQLFTVKVEATGFRPVEQTLPGGAGDSRIEIQMRELASRAETVTVTADVNETDVLSPDPAEKVFVRQELLDANPGRPGHPCQFLDTQSKLLRAESRRHNILRPVWRVIMANLLLSTSGWAPILSPTICPLMHTGTGMPIQTFLFLRRSRVFRWMAAHSTCGKETIRSIWLRPTACVHASILLSPLQEIIEISI